MGIAYWHWQLICPIIKYIVRRGSKNRTTQPLTFYYFLIIYQRSLSKLLAGYQQNQLLQYSNNMSLQCLQNTPSVYFNFDDASNKNTNTNQFLFDLSCTTEKFAVKNLVNIDPSILDLGQSIQKTFCQRLKTEEFFEEFDSHFIVTFQDCTKQAFNILESTAVFPSQKDIGEFNLNNDKQLSQVFMSTNLSIQSNFRKQSSHFNIKPNAIQKTCSFIRQENQQGNEKESPIPAFQVKKRTVFKSKQNILTNAQTFKITKKKIINQNNLQSFVTHPKSDKPHQRAQFGQFLQCLTSKFSGKIMAPKKCKKECIQEMIEKKVMIQRKSKSTIFQPQIKTYRENFRSTTIDNWKRKFCRPKKSSHETVKRTSIFQKPFSVV